MDLELVQMKLQLKGRRLTHGVRSMWRPVLRAGLVGWVCPCPAKLLRDSYCRERKIQGDRVFFVSQRLAPLFVSGGGSYFDGYILHLNTLFPEGWRWWIAWQRDLTPCTKTSSINLFDISFCGDE